MRNHSSIEDVQEYSRTFWRLKTQHRPIDFGVNDQRLASSILRMLAETRVWQHQWLRLQLVICELLTAGWGRGDVAMDKAELGKALKLQRKLKRAAWWK